MLPNRVDADFIMQAGEFSSPALVFAVSFILCVVLMHYSPHVRAVMHPFDTLVHESAHALMAAMLGAKVSGIKIYFRGGGATYWRYSGNPVVRWLVASVGYPAGAIAGSLLAIVPNYFHTPKLILCVMAPIALILALLSRTVFALATWIVVFSLGAVGVLWCEPTVLQIVLTCVGALMASASCHHIFSLATQYTPQRGRDDGTQDWELLPLPPVVGLWGFVVVTLGAPAIALVMSSGLVGTS